MESPKNLWIWGFLLLGALFIALSLFLTGPKSTPDLKPTLVLAHAEKTLGSASLLKDGLLKRAPLVSRADLGPLDSIETGEIGEVRLDFDSGYRVRVRDSSLVTLERVEDQNGYHIVLILKRGTLTVDSFGRDGELFIAKNGERISATDYSESPLAQAPVQAPVETSAQSAAAEANKGITDQEIQAVMSSHRTSFLKCYTQLLQKDPHAKGDVSLTFTVENSGKMSAIEATSPTLKQTDFKKCLIDVMSRIEFRTFQGPPVSTLFPLKFE